MKIEKHTNGNITIDCPPLEMLFEVNAGFAKSLRNIYGISIEKYQKEVKESVNTYLEVANKLYNLIPDDIRCECPTTMFLMSEERVLGFLDLKLNHQQSNDKGI